MWKPGTRAINSHRIKTLITQLKSPRVIIFMGKNKIFSAGRTISVRMVRTILAMTKVVMLR